MCRQPEKPMPLFASGICSEGSKNRLLRSHLGQGVRTGLCDLKHGKEPAKLRTPGRGCQTGIEHLLLCLQRVNTSHVVAWDVAFFPGSQGSCPPPLPRPKRKEGKKGTRILQSLVVSTLA